MLETMNIVISALDLIIFAWQGFVVLPRLQFTDAHILRVIFFFVTWIVGLVTSVFLFLRSLEPNLIRYDLKTTVVFFGLCLGCLLFSSLLMRKITVNKELRRSVKSAQRRFRNGS